MAFSLRLFLIISSSLVNVSVQDAALIDNVCKRSLAYDMCVTALLSDARSPTADLRGLATVSLNLVLANITDNYIFINDLLAKAQDPSMKGALETCKELYGEEESMHDIQIAFESLEAKSNLGLNQAAGAIGDNAVDCDDRFHELGIRPSPMGLRNQNLAHLSDITAAISNMLPGLLVLDNVVR